MAQQYQVDIVTKVVGASKIAQLDKVIEQLAKSEQKAQQKTDEVAKSLERLRRAADQAGKNTNKLGKNVNGLTNKLAGFAVKMAAAYGAVRLFNTAIQATGNRASAEQRLKNLTSSTGEYETALLAAKVASQRFGVTQTEATQALGDTLSRLSGLGYGLKEVNDIYTGFNTIARQSGVAAEDAAGAFLQLSQALGSGTLQGDELRSILERMPQLGQAIQEALGPAGAGKSIKQLGSEGKLSGDVILQALTKAASGADNLGGKIAQQQLTFERLRQAADRVFVAFGQAFGPMVLSAVDQIVFAMGFMGSLLEQAAGFAQANATALANFAAVALRLGAVVGVIVAVVKAVQLVKKGLDAARNAQIAFMALAGPKAWAVIAGGIAVAAATTYALAEANKAVDQAMTDATTKAEENGQLMVQKLQEQIQLYSRQNDEGQKNKVTKEQEAAATKALAAAQREYQAALGTEQGDIDRKLSVTQAVLAAEKEINGAKLQQANADLQAATSQGEREAAARRIYKLTVENAQLEYEATVATAAAEQQKVQAASRHAQILQKQIAAEVALQRSKKIYNAEQGKALQAAADMVNESNRAVAAQTRITEAVMAGAKATRDKTVEAARVTMQMQSQTQQQNQTNAAIQQGAAAMGQLANEAQRAASASAGISGGGAGGGGGGSGGGGGVWTNKSSPINKYEVNEAGEIVERDEKDYKRDATQKVADAMNKRSWDAAVFDATFKGSDYARMATRAFQRGGMVGPIGSQLYNTFQNMYGAFVKNGGYDNIRPPGGVYRNFMADGGYVTGPTEAVVGEGGEPEYVIPASKMDSAMQRYGSGMRGSSVIPDSANVSVNYSGSTVDMGGTSYINKGDVNGIVSQAVNQTLSTLAKSPRARLGAGLR